MTGPSGAQIHFSSERCRDFSCRVQSYFDLKVSVQNVHWKMRLLSSTTFRLEACTTGLLRRRRSFLPARLELKELNDPCVECDEPLEYRALEADSEDVCPVSCEVVEGALDFDQPDPTLDPFWRLERASVDGDVETSSAGGSVRASALAISSRSAGSYSARRISVCLPKPLIPMS